VKPKLVRGDGGVFDVISGGRTLFSKHEALRFPGEEEILRLLAKEGA
jgi:hypothetical protein